MERVAWRSGLVSSSPPHLRKQPDTAAAAALPYLLIGSTGPARSERVSPKAADGVLFTAEDFGVSGGVSVWTCDQALLRIQPQDPPNQHTAIKKPPQYEQGSEGCAR